MLKVAVVVPCFNEEEFIETFLDNVLSQKTDGFDFVVLIADGGSTDDTRMIITQNSKGAKSLIILDNPAKIVSAGLNIAIKNTDADIIVRMDCHTKYSQDYIQQCVSELLRTGAECVGGAWQPLAKNITSKAIALAFLNPIGSGGAKSRDPNYTGNADTVYLGCWWRKTLVEVGLFDESLVRNQDDELCLRIRRNNGVVFQSEKIKSGYFVRSSVIKLAKQFYQYGFWKPIVAKKHRKIGAFRQLVPALFLLFQLVLTFFSFRFSAPYILYFIGFYLGIVALYALRPNSLPSSSIEKLVSIVCVIIMHYAYGVGTIRGLLGLVYRSKKVNLSISR